MVSWKGDFYVLLLVQGILNDGFNRFEFTFQLKAPLPRLKTSWVIALHYHQ